MQSKLTSMPEALAAVQPGAAVALGGATLRRKPMALVRELVAQRPSDLDLWTWIGSLDVDMLVGAGAVRSVNSAYIGFGAFTSIIWLAVLALAGRGEFSAAFIGAFVISVVPTYLDSPTYSKLQPVLFGAFALLAALSEGGALNVKDRVGSFVSRRADRTAERLSRSPVRDRLAPVTATAGQS